MKKPSVRQTKYGTVAAMLLGALIIFLGMRLDREAVCVAGTAVVILSLVFYVVFVRCPHCGRCLGYAWGDHCPFCGKPFDGE